MRYSYSEWLGGSKHGWIQKIPSGWSSMYFTEGQTDLPQDAFGPKGMHRSRKFCQRGPTLTTFFFQLMRGGRIQMPFRCFAGVPMMAQHWIWLGSFEIFNRSGPVLLRNPMFLWFFRGVWSGPLVFPLNPNMQGVHTSICKETYSNLWFSRGRGSWSRPLVLPSGSAHEVYGNHL